MKQLNEKQLRTLIETPDAELTSVFPGVPRAFLRSEKKRAASALPVETRLERDSARIAALAERRELERLYRATLAENGRLRAELELVEGVGDEVAPRDMRIESAKSGEREATAVVLASDWHAEERVLPESVNGLNNFDLQVFDERARWFFTNALKLLDKEAREINIRNLVVAVLGDMFSGSIHEDLAESNQLGPADAANLLIDTLAGGLYRLLRETPSELKITVVWKLGNHGRFTKKQRVQTEAASSLEWVIAHSLAREFMGQERLVFVRERSLLTYLDVHGFTLRFLHGHAVNYQGGVGGITIPITKAIDSWDVGRRADLTCLGHFHQLVLGASRFVVNGSLIGYNPFAVSIKARPEPARQAFFLVDAKHGPTVRAPILLEAP